MQQQSSVGGLVAAVQALGVPVYTMGMARGLLGAPHADLPAPDGRQLLFRHKRADALKQVPTPRCLGFARRRERK